MQFLLWVLLILIFLPVIALSLVMIYTVVLMVCFRPKISEVSNE